MPRTIRSMRGGFASSRRRASLPSILTGMTEVLSAADVRRPRWSLVVAAWFVGNLIIGYFVIFPLGEVDTLTYYVRAVGHDDVVAPYGSAGAKFAVAEILFSAVVLLTVSVFVNRRHWRRFKAARQSPLRWRATAFTAMVMGAAVIQLMPFLLFMSATDRTVPPLFPDAWS